MAILAVLRARDQRELDMLPDHDAAFDVSEREFDAATGTLTLPLAQRADQIIGVDGLPPDRDSRDTWRFHERIVPVVGCVLRIRRVTAWSAEVHDEDDPAILNGLEWDESRSRLAVYAGIGPHHLVDVERLDVEVDVTDEVDHFVRVRVGKLAGVESQWRLR